MQKTVIVVGDQFSAFANEETVITRSHLNYFLSKEPQEGIEIVVGQGLSHADLEKLRELAFVSTPGQVAPLKLTHKHHADNVMISNPVDVGNFTYNMDLLLNDAQDRLLDHVTGTHVSGMVLIEAARQASIACVEVAYRLQEESIPQGFLWNSINGTFTRFTFPVPSRIVLRLAELQSEDPSCRPLASNVQFFQGGKEVCTMELGFELRPAEVINAIEAKTGSKLVQGLTQLEVAASVI